MILLQQNDKGEWVREAQRLLNSAGFNIAPSDTFETSMQQAVKDFQSQKKITVDGKISDTTWKALGWQSDLSEKSLKEDDFISVAKQLSVEVPSIKAVCEVESMGSGFLADGRPKILFEGHIFWAQLKKKGKDPQQFIASNEDILFPKWTKTFYKGNALEYSRLSRAQSIDYEAALASTSWGTFQIMGFNYKQCGYNSLAAYINSCYINSGHHLKAFAAFITSAGLLKHLKEKNWAAFAMGFNGSAYKQNQYDTKLSAAYAKHAAKV